MSKILPVVIDTETTGVDLDNDSICQVAAVLIHPHAGPNTQAVTLFSTYCNPGKPIPAEATAIHGVTDADVRWSMPAEWALMHLKMVLDKLEESGDVVLCGQNHERFDVPLMDRILPSAGFNQYLSLDSYTIAIREFPEMQHKLGEFYEWYCEKQPIDAHDAAADCHMVAAILHKYVNEMKSDYVTLAQEQEQARVLDVFPFGKYKGMKTKDISKSYFNWCRVNFTEVHKDIEETICSVLECEAFTDERRDTGYDDDVPF
jgi:DNA polymerase-3 subunit epsilon